MMKILEKSEPDEQNKTRMNSKLWIRIDLVNKH